jgi:hypothetical protein
MGTQFYYNFKFFANQKTKTRTYKVVLKSNMGWIWWYKPIIPATQEAKVGVPSVASPDKVSIKPYLKNKLKVKGLAAWLKW